MPFYDDFEMKESVEDFARRVRKAEKFQERIVPELEALVAKTLPTIREMMTLPERTEKDEEALSLALKMMLDFSRTLVAIKQVFEERLTIKSLLFYDHIKRLAEEGDARAREIYEELKLLVEEEPSLN